MADPFKEVPNCRVSVAGNPLDKAKAGRLTKVLVDLDVDLFGQCVLVFNDPELQLINGSDFAAGTAVKVELGFAAKLTKVFEGEVVSLQPEFRRDQAPSLRVTCFDSLHRLALSQMTRAFNDVNDKEIATKIAQEHGLSADAPAGSKEHILQANVTDATFLRRLGQKHGNHLRIEGKKLILGPPPQGSGITVNPDAAVHKMKVRIDSRGQIGEVTVHGWDSKTKKEIVGKAKGQGQIGEGAKTHGKGYTVSVAGHESPPPDTATAESVAKGRMRKLAEGYVTASVEMVGDARVIPGELVTFEKVGHSLDGQFRVEHALHEFSKHGYRVALRGVRLAKKKPPKAVKEAKPKANPNGAGSQVDQDKAKDRARHGLINPRWGKPDHDHAEYGEVIVDSKNIDGKVVEFILYHQEPDGNWTEFARKHVVASGKEVRAKVKLLHEDHPDAAEETKGSKRKVPAMLANPRWQQDDHGHGEKGVMTVDVRHGHQGDQVIFVVERKGEGGWEPYGTAEGKVDGGTAKASLDMIHPAAGAPEHPDQDKSVEVRFTAHLQTESGPRAIRFEANVL